MEENPDASGRIRTHPDLWWMFHPPEACWWSSRRYSVCCWQKLSLHHLNLNKWLVDSEAGNPRLFHRHGLRRGRSGRWFDVFWYLSPVSRARLPAGFFSVLANVLNNSLPSAEKFCCKSLRQSQEESTQSDEEANKSQSGHWELAIESPTLNTIHYPLTIHGGSGWWFRWYFDESCSRSQQIWLLEIRWLAFQRSVMWRTML